MATARKFDTAESRITHAVCIAVNDLCVRTGAAVVLSAQLVLATCFVAGLTVRLLAVALWHRIHPSDRVALGRGLVAAGIGVRRLPGLLVSAASAGWWLLGRINVWVASRGEDLIDAIRHEAGRREAARRARTYRLATVAEVREREELVAAILHRPITRRPAYAIAG